jgi:hypothetical protein
MMTRISSGSGGHQSELGTGLLAPCGGCRCGIPFGAGICLSLVPHALPSPHELQTRGAAGRGGGCDFRCPPPPPQNSPLPFTVLLPPQPQLKGGQQCCVSPFLDLTIANWLGALWAIHSHSVYKASLQKRVDGLVPIRVGLGLIT